jgi:hypothetical protein
VVRSLPRPSFSLPERIEIKAVPTSKKSDTMGCNIHLFTEAFATTNSVKSWYNCDNWRLNRYYEPNNDDGEFEYTVRSIYRDRDYSLFAVLADVRNYGDDACIDSPRGLPEDVSTAIEKESNRWDGDGHSHSYFTLAELKEFRKHHGTTQYAGLVSPDDAEMLDSRTGTPRSWCQGTSDKSWVHRTWVVDGSPLDGLIASVDKRMRDEFYIWRDEVDTTEYEGMFRIVFWFDN